MLASLVGLLVLSSVCSSMMLQNNSKYPSEIEGLTTDPNTHRLSDLQPQSTRSGPMQLPPTDLQWPPGPNMTNNNMRMLLPDGTNTPTLPEPDTSICDMLFSAPIPPSIDQIPLFCICSHCKGTTGPKGDRGDRGLPGTQTTLNHLQVCTFVFGQLLKQSSVRFVWWVYESRLGRYVSVWVGGSSPQRQFTVGNFIWVLTHMNLGKVL